MQLQCPLLACTCSACQSKLLARARAVIQKKPSRIAFILLIEEAKGSMGLETKSLTNSRVDDEFASPRHRIVIMA